MTIERLAVECPPREGSSMYISSTYILSGQSGPYSVLASRETEKMRDIRMTPGRDQCKGRMVTDI